MNQKKPNENDTISRRNNSPASPKRKIDDNNNMSPKPLSVYQELFQIEEAILKVQNDIASLKNPKKSIISRIMSKLSHIEKQNNGIKQKIKYILKAIMQKNGKPRSRFFGVLIILGKKFLSKPVYKKNYTSDDRVATALRMVIKENDCRITHIIAVPFLKSGGADLVAINYAKAILQNPENSCMILMTDANDEMMTVFDWLPKNILIVSIAAYIDNATWKERSDLVYGVIQYYLPRTFHIINSSASWMMLIDKGKFISKMTRFYGSIFALQFDNNGRTVGYASEYLKKALPYLDAIITDNNQFVYDAFREFDLPANQKSKFKVIYNPSRVKVEENKYPIIKHNDLKLLWAGRIDKEKYPDLIKHIIDFDNRVSVDMYGSTVVDSQSPIKASERLHLMGPFLDISDIKDICKYDAFIFTSKWEGLPNILLEIASLGLPIIAPDVGGVPELINSNTGFLVHGSRNVSGYLDAIMSIREDPAEAIRRSRNLQEVIKNRHSWQQFIENVLRIQDYV